MYRDAIPGNAPGSTTEAPTPATDASSGMRTPMRSTMRPAGTPSSIGSAARIDIMLPTVSVDAPMDRASSEIVRRQPLNAACARTVAATIAARGT